jgi:hypothetical protein
VGPARSAGRVAAVDASGSSARFAPSRDAAAAAGHSAGTSASPADRRADQPTAAPRVERVEARGGFVWARGHYEWQRGAYVWIPGHWERARAKLSWNDARWELRGNVWVLIPGGWR